MYYLRVTAFRNIEIVSEQPSADIYKAKKLHSYRTYGQFDLGNILQHEQF